MMVADPGLVAAQRIELLVQFQVALPGQGRIDTRCVKGGEKNSEAHAVEHDSALS
jgi:hypothetical protein